MANLYLFILLALVFLGGPACTIVSIVEVFNNASSSISISVDGKTHIVDSLGVARFDYPSNAIGCFQILHDARSHSYDLTHPSNDYYRSSFYRGVIRLQFEPDALVYILRANEEYPLAAQATQPGPFPLHPIAGPCSAA